MESKFRKKFREITGKKKSMLCAGLDPDILKIPEVFKKEEFPLFSYSARIAYSVSDFVVAYKPNVAFFEKFGSQGLLQFEMLIRFIKENIPDTLIIADAKRGDLANTAEAYASYYFDTLNVDSLTVSPYMGIDSLKPYLEKENSQIFMLCLTSNPGSSDLQKIKSASGKYFYQETASICALLNESYMGRVGLVVGGTHPSEIAELRKEHKEVDLLIPGFGTQGGDLKAILDSCGKNSLINTSRVLMVHPSNADPIEEAYRKAKEIQKEFSIFFE